MWLLNTPRCIEEQIAAEVLADFGDSTQGVYGGGPLVAGRDFELLLDAFRQGRYLGVVGATITEDLLPFPSELRARLGEIWNLVKVFIVADSVSFEWAAHLAVSARLGTYLGWALSPERATRVLADHVVLDGTPPVIDDVGLAICAAIARVPAVYRARHAWGQTNNLEAVPIVRFAREAGVQQNVCFTLEHKVSCSHLVEGAVPIVSGDLVAQRAEEVRKLLRELAAPRAVSPLVQALGPAPVTALSPSPVTGAGTGAPPLLELGAVFDPKTHYCADYFGGGRGLRYTRPDGSVDTYHGPAHDWGGFPTAATWLRRFTPLADGKPGAKLVDLGTGSGAFVGHALNAGFDAYGVDISKDAIASSPVKDRLFRADLIEWARGRKHGGLDELEERCDLVTALDFWEHIWLKDVDALIEATAKLLRPGGLGFFVICTRGSAEQDYTFEPGVRFSPKNSWLLCSGHVTIRRWEWWARKFDEHKLRARLDITQLFQVLRAEDPSLCKVDSWSARNTIFVEKR